MIPCVTLDRLLPLSGPLASLHKSNSKEPRMDGAERHVCVRRELGDLCEAGWAGVVPRSRDVAHRVSEDFPALASVSAAKIIIFSLSASLRPACLWERTELWPVGKQEADSCSAPATDLLHDPGMGQVLPSPGLTVLLCETGELESRAICVPMVTRVWGLPESKGQAPETFSFPCGVGVLSQAVGAWDLGAQCSIEPSTSS